LRNVIWGLKGDGRGEPGKKSQRKGKSYDKLQTGHRIRDLRRFAKTASPPSKEKHETRHAKEVEGNMPKVKFPQPSATTTVGVYERETRGRKKKKDQNSKQIT